MGLFRVKGRLTGPNGLSREVEFLVDTGATLVVVPQALAAELKFVSSRSQPIVTAGGQREVWPVAEVRISLEGAETTTPCFVSSGVRHSWALSLSRACSWPWIRWPDVCYLSRGSSVDRTQTSPSTRC